MPLKPLNLSTNLPGGLDRRVFVKGLGYVSLGLFLSTLGGCESCREQIANRPTRRRLRTGNADVDADIATYKAAVTAMQALPASNPRSWAAQAAIHGTVNGGFNHCAHGTTHFFDWHRAYLFYFEQICQELTGNQDFGLPYWNWNQSPRMHPEFTAAGSVLNHPRSRTSVAGNAAFSDGTLDTIFGDSNFITFSDQLEGSPHDMTHILIGQDMVTGGSPLDPIFWAHHNMVDYCWYKWNAELGNDNPNDSAWINTAWNHFVDGDGNPVASVTAGTTILMPLLSYQYESSAIGSNPKQAAKTSAEFTELETRLRKGADVQFDIKSRVRIADLAAVSLGQPFSREVAVAAADFSSLIESDTAAERVFASVEWAEMPPTNDFFVRVFLNKPDADAATPTDDPHYAGSFAFFGTINDGHGKTDFLVNVTDTLQRLKAMGETPAGSPLSVQLVAVPVNDGGFTQPDAELVLEKIDLIVSPVLIRSD